MSMERAIYTMKEEPLVCKVLSAFFITSYSCLRAIPLTQGRGGEGKLLMFWNELQIWYKGENKDKILDCLCAWSLHVYIT